MQPFLVLAVQGGGSYNRLPRNRRPEPGRIRNNLSNLSNGDNHGLE